jgi:anhydro-N-acetylmuramic acid kinase
LGEAFADAVNILIKKNHIHPLEIVAIGSHGQTLRHYPARRFTLQIADPNIIAAKTGITTVADFRRRDMANGGQGAPLVPAFHEKIFAEQGKNRVIVNIGGIANITLLTSAPLQGYDTGPGNHLMNAWAQLHWQVPYDQKGIIASKGRIQKNLLEKLLEDPYFQTPAPKATGPEYFNLHWLKKYLSANIAKEDIQATLTELTAESIVREIKKNFTQCEIYICGGGVHNDFLMERIRVLAAPNHVATTAIFGIDPDWMEAMAFAFLAKQTLEGKPGNITSVTGARAATILGGVYFKNIG